MPDPFPRTRSRRSFRLAPLLWLLTSSVAAEPETLVYVNGAPTAAWFNDGDTLQLRAGPLAARSARVAGVNALESYGPVHHWPGFTPGELLALAKQAALVARRGVWRCTIDQSRRDAYDRLLADCPDLATALLRRGLAHAYALDGPAPPPLLAAQQEAIAACRGLWSRGVPALLVTSVHSTSERLRRRPSYHRVVSTSDGAAWPWPHRERLRPCERFCAPQRSLTPGSRAAVLDRLRDDPAAAAALRGRADASIAAWLDEIATTGRVPRLGAPAAADRLIGAVSRLQREPALWITVPSPGTCMTYVPLELRREPGPICARGR